jgi:hypothetical protein
LGQTAATLLLLAYGAETINLRGAIANPEKIPAMKSFSVTAFLLGFSSGLFNLLRKPKVQLETTSAPQVQETVKEETTEADREVTSETPEIKVEESDSTVVTAADTDDKQEATETEVPERAETTEVTEISATEKGDREIESIAPATREKEEKTIPTNLQTKTAKKENFFSRLFNKDKSKQTGLTAAPILEADEEEFEQEPEKETPTSTAQKAEVSDTASKVISEVEQTPAIAEETETTDPKAEVEVIETIVIEPKDFKAETPSTNSEAIAEVEIETPPQETSSVSEPETTPIESTSTEQNANELDKNENIQQPQSIEEKDDTSALKAEIAKIFEEDDNPKENFPKDQNSNPES